ncbi:hypothetical protein HYX12_01305 [Candidatus Woesearchaeota archaeon]|nr:hypothetical protein [Candidatus Woesearchaeota archaeon]
MVQLTDKLQKGDTAKLADGTEIGVSEILYQSYAGGVHSATFFVGASKLELQDTNVTSIATGGTTLKVGSESISGATANIEGTDDDTTFTLTKIRINMTAQDDYFVPAGGKLSEEVVAAGDDKEIIFSNNWDVEYKGLTEELSHDIGLFSTSDRKYNLHWYDGDGNLVNMPFAYAVSNTNISLTEDARDKAVTLNELFNVTKDDYFVVTGGSAAQGTAKSYALQYKGADKSTATSPKIKFKNLGSGETLEYSLDTDTTSNSVATIKLGGYSFGVYTDVTGTGTSSKADGDVVLRVDLDASGARPAQNTTDDVYITDQYGVMFDFGNMHYLGDLGTSMSDLQAVNFPTLAFNMSVPDTNAFEDQAPARFTVTIGATSTNEVTTNSYNVDGASHNSITPEGEENVGYGYTSMGAKWKYTTPSSSPQELTFTVPQEQRTPQVYVTSGATTSMTTTAGDLVAVKVVDATKLDSEVASVSAQNLIVVGGPCVNTVAAELLGNPADCAEGFTPGKARVKLFENGEKVAMLVAGYSGADTRLAGKVVAHRWSDAGFMGDEVEIEGTTYSDATIGAPTVATTTVVEEAAAADATTEETTTE